MRFIAGHHLLTKCVLWTRLQIFKSESDLFLGVYSQKRKTARPPSYPN